MTMGSRLWPVVATLYTVINVAGAVYAAVLGEWPHAGVHVGLLAAGVGLVLLRARRTQRQDVVGAQLVDHRLAQLQQSLDAIALEVERIGEAQRFSARVVAERIKGPEEKPQP